MKAASHDTFKWNVVWLLIDAQSSFCGEGLKIGLNESSVAMSEKENNVLK